MNTQFLFEGETYKIIGACFEVYKEKGCGFVEPVYQECMEIELKLQGIPYIAQKSLGLEYKGTPLRCSYEPDLICYDKIVVELKAVKDLIDEHRAQVQNYLRASGLQLGLLVNFGHYPKAQLERIVNTRGRYSYEAQSQVLTPRVSERSGGSSGIRLVVLFSMGATQFGFPRIQRILRFTPHATS